MRTSPFRYPSLVATFLVLIVVLHYAGPLRPLEALASTITMPATGVAYRAKLSFTGFFDRLSGVDQQEIVELRARVLELTKENTELKSARDENDTLRKQLQFNTGRREKQVLANVIGFSTTRTKNSIIIDKGERDGIKPNRAVVTEGNIIIGKIVSVSPAISHVLLLTDSSSKTISTILSKPAATGIIKGEFQIGLIMDLIPVSEKIAARDVVVTAGLEEFIPKGLVIGSLSELKTLPTDFFQTASIQPAVDYADLRVVNVILP